MKNVIRSVLLFSCGIFFLAACQGAPAPIPNGGLESGDFTGWAMAPNNNALFADYSVISSLGPVLPTEGNRMAFVKGVSNVGSNNLFTDAFDWSSFDLVCFDIRVLWNGDNEEAFIEIRPAPPPNAQPIVAVIRIRENNSYSTTSVSEDLLNQPFLDATGTGFQHMTEWIMFCIDPSTVPFLGGDPNTVVNFSLRFGWSGSGPVDQAYLIDNVRGVSPTL